MMVTFALSYSSVVPVGVAINVITSQSMVLSGGGARVSVITPKILDRLFFTFSVVSEVPSTCEQLQRFIHTAHYTAPAQYLLRPFLSITAVRAVIFTAVTRSSARPLVARHLPPAGSGQRWPWPRWSRQCHVAPHCRTRTSPASGTRRPRRTGQDTGHRHTRSESTYTSREA